MKIEVRDVRIRVKTRFRRVGSVLAGTAGTTCDGVWTDVTLESTETDERVAQLVRMAEASCYTLGALRGETQTTLDLTANGRAVRL